MDRNYIVELIKANRLQEALKALEKATEGSHLHNQVIMLSSSYAEYAQMNRTATQDFQTLEMQRAKITNSLLSFLDEVSPQDFEKAEIEQSRSRYVSQPAPTNSLDKRYIYAAGAIVLLIIMYFAFSGPSETVVVQPSELNENTLQNESNVPAQTNTDAITGETVQYVAYDNGHFSYDGTTWLEEANSGGKFRFEHISHSVCCVELHDVKRNITIEFDLPLKQIKWTDNKNGTSGGYYITEVR